ncbi:MAG TPA: murein biosynthesis integral membrane protein MurJ [Myxococcota bacterium]|nr:murein biosynthesis integral membrane protein MurJ [Myxococcota bacterium]
MAGRDTLLLTAANLLARITGLAREVVFSAVFGGGLVTDAFNAAFRVPQLFRELLVEGSLQNALVPSLLEEQERKGEEEAWKLANAALCLLGLILSLLTLLLFVGAPFWVQVVAKDYADNPEKMALTVSLTRWLSPFLAGLSLAGFLGGILNSRGRFLGPALTQNLLNLLVLGACFAGSAWETRTGQPPIVLVALTTSVSGFLQLLLLLPGLYRSGFRFRPQWGHPALGGMLRRFGPALVGISTVQLNLLIESQWAAGYGDGPLTWLLLSFRLIQLPLAVFAGSVATAALAELALQHARGDEAGFAKSLGKALRLNSLLVLPSAVAFVVLAEPLARFCFERGAFTPEATLGTAAMLRMYGLACFGICFHRVAVPVYYAMNQPRLPARLSIGALAAKLPVLYLLTGPLGMGMEALPLSHAITVGGESIFLYAGLRPFLKGEAMLQPHLKLLFASGILACGLWWLSDQLPVWATCAVGGLGYLGLVHLLGVRELGGLFKRRGMPPFVDPQSAEALQCLAREAWWDGSHFRSAGRAWRPVASGGLLRLEEGPVPENTALRLAPGVAIVVRLGQGPPGMRGLAFGDRCWSAEGGFWKEGPVAGPRIPVE